MTIGNNRRIVIVSMNQLIETGVALENTLRQVEINFEI